MQISFIVRETNYRFNFIKYGFYSYFIKRKYLKVKIKSNTYSANKEMLFKSSSY